MPVRRMLANLYRRLPLSALCRVENLRNALSGAGKYYIEPDDSRDMGIVQLTDEMGKTIHICRFSRRRLYRHGITRRVDNLARAYCLDDLKVKLGGVLIDCGANVGELGMWARSRGLAYIPFEPELSEAMCCDLNNFGGSHETRRFALWKETTTLPFYSKPESADSSLFKIGGDYKRFEIEAVTLDSALDLTQLSSVPGTVVFKVEAEGAEPEVLQGATRTLSEVDWVAIDCGYERGIEKAHTFVETNTIMQDHGFRLYRAKFDRVTALYWNTGRLAAP